jgi:hypothetical protein
MSKLSEEQQKKIDKVRKGKESHVGETVIKGLLLKQLGELSGEQRDALDALNIVQLNERLETVQRHIADFVEQLPDKMSEHQAEQVKATKDAFDLLIDKLNTEANQRKLGETFTSSNREIKTAIKELDSSIQKLNSKDTAKAITELKEVLIPIVEHTKKKPEAPDQAPGSFVPMRRVRKVGNRLEYDDSTWSGAAGGASSSGSGGGLSTNDGSFATPTNQTTANISLSSIDGKLTHLTDNTQSAKMLASSTDYYPMYNRRDMGGTQPATDPSGALVVRGAVLTDEGTGRSNFTGSSLSQSIGTATFTNGSTAVTGTGFTTLDLHFGDFIKLDADGASSWAQVGYIESDTSITLYPSAYSGSSATGAASMAPVGSATGTGQTISVASGQLTLALGATTAAHGYIYRQVYGGFNTVQASFSISQRVANQDIYFGIEQGITTTSRFYSRFHFTGTTNTQVVTETAWNPTTTPSASETESNTISLPSGDTSTIHTYQIEQQYDRVNFYVDGTMVATHTKRIPHAMNSAATSVSTNIRGLNGTTPTTGTNIVVDYIYAKSYNRLDVADVAPTVNKGATDGNTRRVTLGDGTQSIGSVTQNTASNFNAQVVGSIASGTADSGNPVKVGGKYNSTKPTFTDGQRGDFQIDTKGNQATIIRDGAGNDRQANVNASGQLSISADAVVPGTAATNLGKAEDAGHTSGDTGVMALAVRNDTATALAGTTLDYIPLTTDANGALWVSQATKLDSINDSITSYPYGHSYVNITTNATTTVKSGAGTLHSIVVNNPADITVTKLTMTIYDNTAGSGTKIGTVTVPLLTTGEPFTIMYNSGFGTGLTIVTAGPTVAADLTVNYR